MVSARKESETKDENSGLNGWSSVLCSYLFMMYNKVGRDGKGYNAKKRNKKYAESIKASRDNIKIRKKSTVYGVEFVLLGLESQENIHYAMPMRVMGYDYAAYKKQYDSNAQKYKTAEGLNEDEFLSRMKKTDRFIPVITVVVYYGEKEWDGAKSLHEMLNIPEKMAKYVNDYKMLLVEAKENNLVLHKKKLDVSLQMAQEYLAMFGKQIV